VSIVISGASGQLGRGAVEAALQRVAPAELILVTRTPAALADYADRGASVRFGDL
jgi:NAD(P)H dehydrogenase (quinone)